MNYGKALNGQQKSSQDDPDFCQIPHQVFSEAVLTPPLAGAAALGAHREFSDSFSASGENADDAPIAIHLHQLPILNPTGRQLCTYNSGNPIFSGNHGTVAQNTSRVGHNRASRGKSGVHGGAVV